MVQTLCRDIVRTATQTETEFLTRLNKKEQKVFESCLADQVENRQVINIQEINIMQRGKKPEYSKIMLNLHLSGNHKQLLTIINYVKQLFIGH